MPLRVLVAGAGVAALEAVLALEEIAGPALEVHLIAPAREFVHRPLAVGEPFGYSTASRVAIVELLRARPSGHMFDEVVEVFPDERRLVTKTGLNCDYDALLVATGARTAVSLPGSLTFGGPDSVAIFRRLLEQIEAGTGRRLVFVLPREVAWGLPLYELALMTASWLFERRVAGVELTLITHEDRPLAAFGGAGSVTVLPLLERQGIRLETAAVASAVAEPGLVLEDGRLVGADAVVSLPRLQGRAHLGLPSDPAGFLPVDEHQRVRGVENVWAAGDGTDRLLKQGGLAAQQADAAAESIAAWAGMPVRPTPYRPVLRGLLLTGDEPHYLRAEVGPRGEERYANREKPLWWPPAKIAGRYLAPVLAAHGMEKMQGASHAAAPDA